MTSKHQLGPNSCIQTVQMSTPILSKTLPVSHATSQQRTPAASVKTDSYKLSCTNNSLSANCLFSPPLNTFGTSEGYVQEVSASSTAAKAINRIDTINELVWRKQPVQPCLLVTHAAWDTGQSPLAGQLVQLRWNWLFGSMSVQLNPGYSVSSLWAVTKGKFPLEYSLRGNLGSSCTIATAHRSSQNVGIQPTDTLPTRPPSCTTLIKVNYQDSLYM